MNRIPARSEGMRAEKDENVSKIISNKLLALTLSLPPTHSLLDLTLTFRFCTFIPSLLGGNSPRSPSRSRSG
eukprot:754463-Hanusia_phi.AAC.4